MPAFGENLQREREMRGVSLEEISSATKISMRFLRAIEEEDFAKLPGGIFARSFIRSYARYLGLDEERVMAEYLLAARPQTEVDLHRFTPGRFSTPRPASRSPLVGALVAAVLLAGGYALFRYSRPTVEIPSQNAAGPAVTPTETAPPAPAPNANPPLAGVTPPAGNGTPGTAPTTAPATVPGMAPSAAVSKPAASQNPATQSPAQPVNPPGTRFAPESGLVLQVAATERAWVAVDADGKTVLQRVLNPNDVETVKAHDSFDVTAGNSQGIILTLNGETLKPLGRRGEVKTVHLTRDDLKSPAP
jgi:cytoskeleton protein RodZ